MSRGHKIIQTFLQKRGAWDNNPYKEPEMKKPEPPFEPDKKPKRIAVAGKYGYGPSAARHLARKGLEQMAKLNPKLKETWSDGVLDQLSEVHPTVMAMARVGANKALKAKADQHTQLALAANKAGDDEKVRYHQAQVAKLKAQMQKEAVTYTGLGTDVVDKKKKLNPQPNLMMKPKQVKDFKEENLDELKASTLQSYADKAHQQALDATYDAAHLNRPGEEKFKAAAKRLASKRAGGVQMAQTKLDKMKEALELPHSIGDTVRCTRTQRLATVAGFDNDQYTVVYGDGSTETGPANYWTTVHKVNKSNSTPTNEACVTPVNYSLYKGRRLHFCGSKGKSASSKSGGSFSSGNISGEGGAGNGNGGDGGNGGGGNGGV